MPMTMSMSKSVLMSSLMSLSMSMNINIHVVACHVMVRRVVGGCGTNLLIGVFKTADSGDRRLCFWVG
jgi:hypothetical protein